MEQVNMMLEPLRVVLIKIGEFLPKLLLAIVVLIIFWLIARAVKYAVVKGLKAINFNVLTDKAGLDGFLRQGGLKTDTIMLLGILLYWFVVLAGLVVAFNTLELTQVTQLLGTILLFVPKVIVALLILIVGGYFARFVAKTVDTYCRNVGIENAEFFSRVVLYAIMIFVILLTLGQLNVSTTIIDNAILIILGGVALALALAFGLGSQKWAGDQLERWWSGKKR